MKLNLAQIASITCGAVTVREENDRFVFYRFTEEQMRCYDEYRGGDYIKRTMTNAGVRFAFETDSSSFGFTYSHKNDFSWGLAWLEIFVDGKRIAEPMLDANEVGKRAEVTLGEGTKRIEVHFPWRKAVAVEDVTLDDDSLLVPVKRSRVMICYGDSITNGCSTQLTSATYVSRIAEMLDADAYNKAIGGDRFFPELLEFDEPITPDIVTVAYGTNDWNIHSRPTVVRRSGDFLTRLTKKYPSAKIFVISPIWRAKNTHAAKFDGPLAEVYDILAQRCAELDNVTLINGMSFFSSDPIYFTDGLHPHDFGMEKYASGLYDEIKKYL